MPRLRRAPGKQKPETWRVEAGMGLACLARYGSLGGPRSGLAWQCLEWSVTAVLDRLGTALLGPVCWGSLGLAGPAQERHGPVWQSRRVEVRHGKARVDCYGSRGKACPGTVMSGMTRQPWICLGVGRRAPALRHAPSRAITRYCAPSHAMTRHHAPLCAKERRNKN